MNKKLLVVGNWKMNLNVQKSSVLLQRLHDSIATRRNIEVVIAPSTLSLQPLSLEIDRRRFKLASQDAYDKDDGPYTGEVSFAMLRGVVHYGLVGHSARRLYFGESLNTIRSKVRAAVRSGIVPIICIGETRREREAKETKQVLHDQLTTALMDVTSEDIESVVIAYEPVWAISTFDGMVAKPHEAAEAIRFIRAQIEDLYGKRVAEAVRILYGGSIDHTTARSYLELPEVDGVLVGAASLNYQQFAKIVSIAHEVQLTQGV